ncbi:MAG: hypothetical protein ACKVOU_06040 [Cytophagales bacterium]
MPIYLWEDLTTFIKVVMTQEMLQGFRIERDYLEAYHTFEVFGKIEIAFIFPTPLIKICSIWKKPILAS